MEKPVSKGKKIKITKKKFSVDGLQTKDLVKFGDFFFILNEL
jgi:hypothetical protein